MKKEKTQKGITLIALIITIIVLAILAVVAIGAVQDDGGIINYAKNARTEYQAKQVEEEGILQNYLNLIDESTEGDLISKTKSYVGCYADVDGNGTVDGIIYADLAVGGSGKWGGVPNIGGPWSYTIPGGEEGLKDYYVVTGKKHKGVFSQEEKDIIRVSKKGTGTKDRFYVMALSDFGTYYWYENAANEEINDYRNDMTSKEFGAGKTNTETILANWKADTRESKNTTEDLWGNIESQVEKGWFVPSVYEWLAFVGEMKIPSGEDVDLSYYGLQSSYWTSCVYDEYDAYYFMPWAGEAWAYMDGSFMGDRPRPVVRLSTTF